MFSLLEWIAFRNGYIPLDFNDPLYQAEVEHEKQAGFPPCMCSNCMAQAATTLVQNLKVLNRTNFSDYVLNKFSLTAEEEIITKRKYNTHPIIPPCNAAEEKRLHPLKEILRTEFDLFFTKAMGMGSSMVATDLLGDID